MISADDLIRANLPNFLSTALANSTSIQSGNNIYVSPSSFADKKRQNSFPQANGLTFDVEKFRFVQQQHLLELQHQGDDERDQRPLTPPPTASSAKADDSDLPYAKKWSKRVRSKILNAEPYSPRPFSRTQSRLPTDEYSNGTISPSTSPELSQDGPILSSPDDQVDLEELEEFAKLFRAKRIKMGFTQVDVGLAMGRLYCSDFSQTTISRFEALNLSFKNMCKLKPLLTKWLSDTEKALIDGTLEMKLTSEPPAVMMLESSEGGGSQTSTVEMVGKRRKKRTNIEGNIRTSLERLFDENPKPTAEEIDDIAKQFSMDREVIRVWFCNRRQKEKRSTQGDGMNDSGYQTKCLLLCATEQGTASPGISYALWKGNNTQMHSVTSAPVSPGFVSEEQADHENMEHEEPQCSVGMIPDFSEHSPVKRPPSLDNQLGDMVTVEIMPQLDSANPSKLNCIYPPDAFGGPGCSLELGGIRDEGDSNGSSEDMPPCQNDAQHTEEDDEEQGGLLATDLFSPEFNSLCQTEEEQHCDD